MKRRFIGTFVFVGVGMAVTVLLTWALALRVPQTYDGRDRSIALRLQDGRVAYAARFEWLHVSVAYVQFEEEMAEETLAGWALINGGRRPEPVTGARLARWVATPSNWSRNPESRAVGYPARCLYFHERMDRPPYVRAGWTVSVRGKRRVLPVGMIWRGFVVNMLLYSGILYGLRVLAHLRRRRWRRRTGRCVGCGYELAGVPTGGRCPECGRNPSGCSIALADDGEAKAVPAGVKR